MQLTGKQIADQNIITGFQQENIQQVGIDCRLEYVNTLDSVGHIPLEGKTLLPVYREVKLVELANQLCWHLQPGYYEIGLVEGCKIPPNCMLLLKQRSSLKRCGAECESPVFDPGFETFRMGTFMRVNHEIYIDYRARVCQAIVCETKGNVENLYQGQFQGK